MATLAAMRKRIEAEKKITRRTVTRITGCLYNRPVQLRVRQASRRSENFRVPSIFFFRLFNETVCMI